MNRSIVWLVNSPRFGLAPHAALHNTGSSPATVTKAANCAVESDGGETVVEVVVEVGALVVVEDVEVGAAVVDVAATDVVGGEDELVVPAGANDVVGSTGVDGSGAELLEDIDGALGARDVAKPTAAEGEALLLSLISLVHPKRATTPAPTPPSRPLRNCRREELIAYAADEMSMPRSPSACRSISGSRTVTVTAACLRLTNGISAGTRS